MSGVRFLNAVSMTDTGTPCWTASLRMFCRQAWKSDCASAGPAVMAVVAARMIVLMRGVMPPILSRAGDGHAFYSHRRRVGRALELQVAGRRQVEEHVLEIARHGDAAHRPGALAVLDPEAGGAAAVVAGDSVHAKADQIGDVESALDVGDQLVARELALLEIEIGRGRAGRAGGAACPVGLRLSWRAAARSSSQVVSTPSSITARRDVARPSASNGRLPSPRLRSGVSRMRVPSANTRSPILSLRNEVPRPTARPLMAPARWPTRPPETRRS